MSDAENLPATDRNAKRRAVRAAMKDAGKRLRIEQLLRAGPSSNSSVVDEEAGYSSNDSLADNDLNDDDQSQNSSHEDDEDSDSSVSTLSMPANDDTVNNEVAENRPTLSELEKENQLVKILQEWGADSRVSRSKLDELLKKLKPVFPSVPLSYKTLLSTPRYNVVKESELGSLWYYGIAINLRRFVSKQYLQNNNNAILIDINIDGLPLSERSKDSPGFWLILGRLFPVDEREEKVVFVIGAFCGKGEPKNLWFFLEDFVSEVRSLRENGLEIFGKHIAFDTNNYIFDAQARSFIKCCKGVRGYCCCEKCTIRGTDYKRRMILPDLDCPLRTDEMFLEAAADLMTPKAEHHDDATVIDEHVLSITPLFHCEDKLVSKFRLDSMHLIDKGITRRLIEFWKNYTGVFKLGSKQLEDISERLIAISNAFPSEFNRSPKSFKHVLSYKCTELRRLAMYDGILVFKDIVIPAVYNNFLLYHCAIFILRSPKLCHLFNDEAKKFFRMFVEHSIDLYGAEFCVYNVHSSIHMPDECLAHGPADSFSAYPFENCLKSVKSCVRSGYKPLQQLANRVQEMNGLIYQPKHKFVEEPHLDWPKVNDINEEREGQQFVKLSIGSVQYRVDRLGDSCCKIEGDDVVLIRNLIRCGTDIFVRCRKFKVKDDYYTYPIPSSILGILKVSKLARSETYIRPREIMQKCILLPLPGTRDFPEGEYLCIPYAHQS